jgi:hypothetical protein
MTRYTPAIFVVFLIFTPSSLSVMAASVGVQTGQWAKYTPSQYSGYQYSSVTISISSVSGTTVYGTMTHEFPEGSPQTSSFQYNILTLGTPPYFIPANLKVGDTIGSGIGALVIAGADTRSYAGASRTVVYAQSWATYYWDQQTGILVEQSTVMSSLKLTETNIWGGGIFDTSNPFFWVLIVIIVVIVAALALVVLSSLRKKKPTTETVTPPSPPEQKSPKTKHCLKCGTSMPSDSIYCPKCGHKQPQT